MYERRITMPSFRFSIIVPTKMLPRGVEINLKKVALMQPDTMEGAELVVSQFDSRAEVVKGGIQITFWVPTVSEELMERLDALIDEEYEITKLDFTISNGSTSLESPSYDLLEETYQSEDHGFKQEVSLKCEKILEYLSDNLFVDDDENLDKDAVDKVASMVLASEVTGDNFAETLLSICTLNI